MKKEDFDELLKETLREYVKNTERETTEKVKFSKRHERNMEEIFKSIENGTLGNFAVEEEKVSENDENTKIMCINKFNFRRFAKVAIFVIFALIISLVAPGIEAWRTDELNLYGDNQDEYAWILPNDITERLEVDSSGNEEYLEIFGYLPEGAKIEKVVDRERSLYLKMKSEKSDIVFRVYKDNKPVIDMEDSVKNEIILGDRTIILYSNEDRDTYMWANKEKTYRIFGDMDNQEILKIIENINYEELEEIF